MRPTVLLVKPPGNSRRNSGRGSCRIRQALYQRGTAGSHSPRGPRPGTGDGHLAAPRRDAGSAGVVLPGWRSDAAYGAWLRAGWKAYGPPCNGPLTKRFSYRVNRLLNCDRSYHKASVSAIRLCVPKGNSGTQVYEPFVEYRRLARRRDQPGRHGATAVKLCLVVIFTADTAHRKSRHTGTRPNHQYLHF